MVGTFSKSPTERCPLEIDLRHAVPEGTTLAQVTVSATDLADASPQTATVLTSATGRWSGLIIGTTVRAGTGGHRYRVHFSVRDTVNHVYEETLTLVVRA